VFKNVNTSFTQELKCNNCGTRLTLDLKYGVSIRSIGVFIFFLAPNTILRLLIFLSILFVYPLILWKFGTLKRSVIDVRSEELQNEVNNKVLKHSDKKEEKETLSMRKIVSMKNVVFLIYFFSLPYSLFLLLKITSTMMLSTELYIQIQLAALHYVFFLYNQVFLIFLFSPKLVYKLINYTQHYIGYIIAWLFLSFVLLNMLDGMLQNLYKRNAFIVLGIPLLLGVLAIIVQFSINEKLKAFNTGEL
jgi:energy-converting hydrogenase Eha subunit E